MKSLDAILSELNLTQDQRKHLSDLSETLTSAGGRLRELLTEYQTVKERLDMLTQQHADLEEEYTKLVEQQLGE
jgi:predicted nuclease with TOPRIM domain